jgi:hypothetical protein
MKILKIDDNLGYFQIAEQKGWQPIDEIDKDALLKLLDVFLENDAEMDSPDEISLQNQAHAIIYRNIFEKLSSLSDEKSRFKDESERLYIEELKKYQK